MNNESNSAKSKHCYDLNAEILNILNDLYSQGIIINFKKEPRYPYKNGFLNQFSPDFEIATRDSIIIIDNTTTARHDRFKQKQWDAINIKQYFKSTKNIDILYFIVLPNLEMIGNEASRQKEQHNFYNEKSKIHNSKYFSAIDDIITINDFISFLTK